MNNYTEMENDYYRIGTSQHGKCLNLARLVHPICKTNVTFIIQTHDCIVRPDLQLDLYYEKIKYISKEKLNALEVELDNMDPYESFGEITMELDADVKCELIHLDKIFEGAITIEYFDPRFRSYTEFLNAVEAGLKWSR